MTLLLNIFTNILTLDLFYSDVIFNDSELFRKIYLPKIDSLNVNHSTTLRIFARLSSLKKLSVNKLEEVNDIEACIDPSKLSFLHI